MKKVIILSMLMMFSALTQAQETIEAKYQRSCFACHGTGAAGAPLTGNADQWKDRLAKGMDVLVEHVDKGFNAMPAKGLCMDCTADQFKELITFMSTSK